MKAEALLVQLLQPFQKISSETVAVLCGKAGMFVRFKTFFRDLLDSFDLFQFYPPSPSISATAPSATTRSHASPSNRGLLSTLALPTFGVRLGERLLRLLLL